MRQFSRRFSFRILSILCLFATLLSFQNCGNINLSPLGQEEESSFVCADGDKDLLILASNNTSGNQIAAGNTDFQIYENRNGNVIVFQPEDSTTTIPVWFKNNSAGQGQQTWMYTAEMSDSNPAECSLNQIIAKLNVCGSEVTLRQYFVVGDCEDTQCNEHGVVTSIDEDAIFYKSERSTCEQSCESIVRTCLRDADGNLAYGPAHSEANVNHYTKASCAPVDPSTCTSTTASIPGWSGMPGRNVCSNGNTVYTESPEPAIPLVCKSIPGLQNGSSIYLPFRQLTEGSENATAARWREFYKEGYFTRDMNITYWPDDQSSFSHNSCSGASMGSTPGWARVPTLRFYAIRFSPKQGEYGEVGFHIQNAMSKDGALVSISECPGDFGGFDAGVRKLYYQADGFNRSSGDWPDRERCIAFANQTSPLNWATREVIAANANASNYYNISSGCRLEVGKTYYINVILREIDNFPMWNAGPEGTPAGAVMNEDESVIGRFNILRRQY